MPQHCPGKNKLEFNWRLRQFKIEKVPGGLEIFYGLIEDIGYPEQFTFLLNLSVDFKASFVDIVFGEDIVDIEKAHVLVAVEMIIVDLEQQAEAAPDF